MRLVDVAEMGNQSGGASAFVSACFERVGLAPPARVLDVPCGFGRNASFLARKGFDVAAIDIDPVRVRATKEAPAGCGSIAAQVADATVRLPFGPRSFDIALVIHYVSPRILADIETVLRRGGHLIFETFGGQGHNWIDLPAPGTIRRELEPRFDILIYRERAVGPAKEAVSVKLLARKR